MTTGRTLEWFVELTRRDGGDISEEEVMAAWRDPQPWRRPWWLRSRPQVEADGIVQAAPVGWRVLQPRPEACRSRLLFADPTGSGAYQWAEATRSYVDRLRSILLGRSYQAKTVYRLREFAYLGPIPEAVARGAFRSLTSQLEFYPHALRPAPWAGWDCLAPVMLFLVVISSLRFGPISFKAFTLGLLFVVTGYAVARAIRDRYLWKRSEPWSARAAIRGLWTKHLQLSEAACWAAISVRLCHACGYDLRGSEGPRCSECGQPSLRWWCEQGRLGQSVTVLVDIEQQTKS